MNKVPGDVLRSFSCSLCIQEVVREGLGQTSETPSNHYHQNKLLPMKAVLKHPTSDAKYLLESEHNFRGN